MADLEPVADLAIRRLGPGDGAELRRLNALFAEAFADHDAYGAAPPSDAYLDRVLAKEDVIALAASRAGAVCGGLVAYEQPKLERERSEIYIYDLAVAAPFRRRGVATALIAEVRAIARRRGAWAVSIQADPGDDPAIALYTRLGRREDVLHFDIMP